MKFDVFKKFKNAETEKSLLEIFEAISTGKFAEEIRAIRDALTEGNEEKASELKKNLFAFAPSARFQDERKMECITDYTGMIVLDFDKMGKPEMLGAMEAVRKAPYTTLAFVSPSGNGIKVLVQVSSAVEHHSAAFLAVSKYYEDITGCKTDPSGKDITRLCFLSYDADAFFNSEAKIFQVERTDQPSNRNTGSSNEEYGSEIYDRLKSFTSQVRTYEPGNRNNYIYQLACNANRWGVVEADLQKWVVNDPGFSDLGSEERYDTIKGVYRNNMKEHGVSADSADSAGHVFCTSGERALSNMPYLPDEIFESLPRLISEILKFYQDRRERDVVLLTLLTAIGPCFPNVKTLYRGKVNYLNLFLMIAAPAGSGKSVMDDASKVIEPLHHKLLNQTQVAMEQYEKALAESKKKKTQQPKKPPFRCLRMPANSSAAQVLSFLKDNEGVGYMIETEADTLVNALKQDWGNFSDNLRKSFHHEAILYARKTNSEYIEVPLTRLALSLSGTLDQMARLFQSAENGLVSRFMFYIFDNGVLWKTCANESFNTNLPKIYQEAGLRLLKFVDLVEGKEVLIDIEKHQLDEIDAFFSAQLEGIHIFYEGVESIAMRYAVMVVRIAALLTWLGTIESISDYSELVSDRYICCDIQFKNAMKIINTLLPHAILASQSLPNSNRNAFITSPDRAEWFSALPKNFTRAEAVKRAEGIKMTEDVVDKLIKKLRTAGKLEKVSHGTYKKI